MYAFKGGASAYAFVVAHGHFAGDHTGLLVDHTHGHGNRRNLVGEAPSLQRGAGFLLALCTVNVHGFAADLVARGDLFSGLQHVPVHLRLVLHQPGVGGHVLVDLVLHARDRLHAAGHIHIALVGHHPLRGQRDGLQARRTKPVHGQARHRYRATGPQGRLAGDVGAGCALGKGATHQHIIHLTSLNTGAGNRMGNSMTGQGRAVGHIESALPAFGQRGAGGGNNQGSGHGGILN